MSNATRRKAKSERRASARACESRNIEEWCEHYAIGFRKINEYQYRIEEKLDIFPTSKKYHFLDSPRYATYEELDELLKVLNW